MNYSRQIQLNVWYYNELLDEWIQKRTTHFQETADEYNYFRVMSGGKKEYYSCAEDYINRFKNTADFGESLTNVKGNIIWTAPDNSIEDENN